MRIFDERKYLYIISLLPIIIIYMWKYFVFILSIFIFFWCSENADKKTAENINLLSKTTDNNKNNPWYIAKYELIPIYNNISIRRYYNDSSSACYWSNIIVDYQIKSVRIFDSANNSQNNFAYCSPKIEKVWDDSAKIFICYWAWAGSGECSAGEFEYTIWSNSWKYISHGYYTTGDNNSYSYNIEENNSWEDLKEFLEYMKNKKYIIK